MLHVRPIDSSTEEAILLDLWDQSFSGPSGSSWPLTPAWFRWVALETDDVHDHLLAEIEGRPVGFALAQSAGASGSLLALGVLPGYRRRGVGRALHDAVLERLRARGVKQVQLGSGTQSYFWPGVPTDPPGAWAFFQAVGWREDGRSYDLVRSLDDYSTPAWVWERVRGSGVDFVTADEAGLLGQVIDFVTTEQPDWAPYYAQAVREGRGHDVLLARQAGSGELLGACLFDSPSPRWDLCLPNPVGAPGCIFTARAAQNRGIGMALTARAAEIHQARGFRTLFIGWTWLVDWYGKLGCTVWQEYLMSSIGLTSSPLS